MKKYSFDFFVLWQIFLFVWWLVRVDIDDCLVEDFVMGLSWLTVLPYLAQFDWVVSHWLKRTKIVKYFLTICVIVKFGDAFFVSDFWWLFSILSFIIIWAPM